MWSPRHSNNPRDVHPGKGLSDCADNDRQCQPRWCCDMYDCKRAREGQSRGQLSCCVLHHKTMDTHGPTQIVLTSHLQDYITVLMQEMHSQPPDLDCLDKQMCSCCGVESTWNQQTDCAPAVEWKAHGIIPDDKGFGFYL